MIINSLMLLSRKMCKHINAFTSLQTSVHFIKLDVLEAKLLFWPGSSGLEKQVPEHPGDHVSLLTRNPSYLVFRSLGMNGPLDIL